MTMKHSLKTLACATILALSWSGTAQATAIDIYIGNNASFASSANNPASNQGFTAIRDRWANAGAIVNITAAFNPAGKEIFLATAPQSAWSAAQVTAMQNFLNSGGWFILSHDGFGGIANMNALLGNLGSSLAFGNAVQAGGTTTLNIVNPGHPLMQNMNGNQLNTFSPGSVAGGTALASWSGTGGLPVISFENLGGGGGGILAVADFDILNNVPVLFFPPGPPQQNLLQFWDNILADHVTPEPTSLLLLAVGLIAFGVATRRTTSA